MALRQSDLDRLSCSTPGCDHAGGTHDLELRARCPPRAGINAWYRHGIMDITCHECGRPVTMIQVAP